MSTADVVGIALATFAIGLMVGYAMAEFVWFIRAARESIQTQDSGGEHE